MKTLIYLITIIAATSLVRAGENDEVIWETEKIGGLNEVEVSPHGEVFYNTKDSIVQIRSVETGELIEEILFPNTARLDAISISADGRLMAVSGEPKYIFIYDLVEKQEVKKITTSVFEREENGELVKYNTKKWLSSSISPDGTKVTGIAEGDQATYSTCWIVIDIASGEELIKETRLGYDVSNPDKYGISEWISSEFTPDGNYIVSQLDWGAEGKREPDSIYIHNANTLEVNDVVLNRYSKDIQYYNLNETKNTFTFKPKANSPIHIYNILTKETFETKIDLRLWTFTFLRNSSYALYAYDSEFQLYDYVNDKILHKYVTIGKGWATTLDDRILISSYYNKILGINTFIIKTSIDNDYEEEIVISPNPTSGYINIQLNNQLSSEFQYELINVSGQVIKSSILGFVSQNGQSSIDISDVPNGSYTIRVYSNREDFTFSIIKEG